MTVIMACCVTALRPECGRGISQHCRVKGNRSRYLAAVKEGKEIVVTSHRHPVARIVPMEKTADDLQIIPAEKPGSTLKKIKGLNLEVDLLADLLADRRRR
jgi:prevent-host-death family protein